jgi:antitoxin component of MazEF toxin-antitoxin module
MSEEQKVVPIAEKLTDFTEFDLKAIQRFEDEGMPGLFTIADVEVQRMMELYLHGKTYREISTITNKSKALVLALSKKLDWYPKRIEYLRDLSENMAQRTLEAHVVGQDFLLQLKHVFEKKIGGKIRDYLRTGDEMHVNSIDLKEIDKYIKTLETLGKMTEGHKPKGSNQKPAVGINVGEGVTVAKKEDGTIEISPKEKATGSALAQLANLRRQAEENKSSDIKKNNSEGEKK